RSRCAFPTPARLPRCRSGGPLCARATLGLSRGRVSFPRPFGRPRAHDPVTVRFLALSSLVVLLPCLGPSAATPAAEPQADYRPKLRTPEEREPFLPYLKPGGDAFADEKEAEELGARLAELGRKLRASRRGGDALADLLAPAFRGGRLAPVEETVAVRTPSLEVIRAGRMAPELVLDARAFSDELRRLLAGFRDVTVAEFLITAIAVEREKAQATTDVRYDFVGTGTDAWRVERSGRWR